MGRDNYDEEEGISEATLSPACQYKLNQNYGQRLLERVLRGENINDTLPPLPNSLLYKL